MPKRLFAIVFALLLYTTTAQASMILTFDSDLDGFTGDGAVSHASLGGNGVLKLATTGGWQATHAVLNMLAGGNAAFLAEWQAAVTNGGTLSYDVTIVDSEQVTSAVPTWFESSVIFNGPWEQKNSNLMPAFNLGGTQTTHVVLNVTSGATTSAGDGILHGDNTNGTQQLMLGANTDGARVSGVTLYFDNVTISAVSVPEPSSFALLSVAGVAGMVARRRRKTKTSI